MPWSTTPILIFFCFLFFFLKEKKVAIRHHFPHTLDVSVRKLQRTSSSNSAWKPGQGIDSPVGAMISLDPSKMQVIDVYKLLIGSIVPRPIAFVSTINSAGVGNLAPFSFFNGISSNPPCIMISISRKPDGGEKDTLRNLKEVPQFVVNTASEWIAEPLVHCASNFPYGVNEMEQVGLTALPSVKVKPLRVKESPVHMECEVYKTVEIGDGGPGSTVVIFGKVLLFHVHEKAYKDGKIIIDELLPLARLGGIGYTRVNEIFEIPVPILNR